MVIWSYPQSRSIPTFKLHRVIVTALGANVKFFFQYISRETGHIGGIGVHFGGPGHSVLGAGGERFVFYGW